MAHRTKTAAALLLATTLALAIGFVAGTAVRPAQAQDADLTPRVAQLERQVAALQAENARVAEETAKVAAETTKVAGEITKLTAEAAKIDTTLAAINTRQEMRFVRAVGIGRAKAQPDLAVVNLGIEVQAPSSAQALVLATRQSDAIIGQLAALGVTAADVDAAAPTVAPIQDDQRKITGYRALAPLLVKVKDPAKKASLLDAVVKLGGNNFKSIEFKLADPEKLKAQARELAIREARTRAEAYARANGGTLGAVQEISEDFIPREPRTIDPSKPQVLEEQIEVLVVFELK